MKKDKYNSKFREYARTLSPLQEERDLIGRIYQSFNDLLGINNCIQIGSYPRFTAITPIHDLDILYFLGNWNEKSHDPASALQNLSNQINKDYKNPTNYEIKISLQTHSVTVVYLDNSEEIFSVDIVPAYIFSRNEFNEDIYKVPEILGRRHGKARMDYYQALVQENRQMGWVSSDPRGYISVASDVDKSTNGEFRKTVKIVKVWKNNLEISDQNLKLKSFHLEQVITKYFQDNPNLEIFDAIYNFFIELPEIIGEPNQICDRANNDKYIDDYLENLDDGQKQKIKAARDGFLIKLEHFKETSSIEELFEINIYYRKPSEQFLFDFKIATFIDPDLRFKIDGFVKPLAGFSSGWITKTPQLQKGITCGQNSSRKIEFSIQEDNTMSDQHRWKVRNSDDCPEPRGEITISQTRNNPEATKYASDSYVECYAIKNGICVARQRLNVKIA